MEGNTILNPNPLVKFLNKPQKEFTKADIIRYVTKNDIEMINFRYAGADGRLKTLNFIINSLEHLDSILTYGERVDGSSLFPYIQAGSSDLYVIPRYRTAFLNPFSDIPALDILCSYYTKDGKPLESAPEYTLRKAHEEFKKVTGMEFQAMGELEYYVISEKEDLFETPDQRGYHESMPFCNGPISERKQCVPSHKREDKSNTAILKSGISRSVTCNTNRMRSNFCRSI